LNSAVTAWKFRLINLSFFREQLTIKMVIVIRGNKVFKAVFNADVFSLK